MPDVNSAYDVVAPILRRTYGDNAMAHSLAMHLADLIKRDDWRDDGREREIMLICWNWFPGGTTAEGVARRIEAALT